MKKIIICAMGSNSIIGNKNELPWKGIEKYKFDMRHFKNTTTGNIVVMGYNTYCSLGKKGLKDRINIVISSNHYDEILKDSSIDYVFKTCDELNKFIDTNKDSEEFKYKNLYIIGGSKLYNTFLQNDDVDELILTIFNDNFEGDRYFPIELLINKYDFAEKLLDEYPAGRIVKYTRNRLFNNVEFEENK